MSIAIPLTRPLVRPLTRAITEAGVGAPVFSIIDPVTGLLSSAVTFSRGTTGTLIDVAGLIQVAAINAARYTYDPVSHVLRGLLVEEQRTNLLVRSTLAGGGAAPTGWGRPIGTGTSAPGTSSFGNADGAIAYDQVAVAQRPFIGSSGAIAADASSTYVLSEFVEAITGSEIALDMIRYSTVPVGGVTSYPATPANPSGGASGVVAAGRLVMNMAIAATPGSAMLYVGPGCAGSATATTRFSRPQFELGLVPTSYIPTGASTVTRDPDIATITGLSSIAFNPAVGTLYVEAFAPCVLGAASTLASFNDNTSNEVIRLHLDASGSLRAQVIDGGVTVADLALGNLTAGSVFKAAVSYAANDIKGCLNGGTVQTDASATLPTVDRLMLGRGAAGNYWNSTIRAVTYSPAIRNTQAITA